MAGKLTKRQQKKLLQLMLTVLLAGMLLVAQKAGWIDAGVDNASQFQPGQYRVETFNDGDTITVNMNGTLERIRMIGVDTPETQDPRVSIQCFGKAASAFTKELIGEKPVRLEADPDNTNRDRYDRLLRYVYLPDGTLVNAEIIKQGYGFAYTLFPFQRLEEFRTYEQTARDQSLGLWGSCSIEETDTKRTTNPVIE